MPHHLNISSPGIISEGFRKKGVFRFAEAADFVRQLPYKRNSDKTDLSTVFSDGHGTCSTKHALLRQLATENGWDGFRLMLCLFKMNAANTPAVACTLQQYGLPYLPEAHNYLRVGGTVFDCTTQGSTQDYFIHDLLFETEIEPVQIGDFKVAFHKDFLEKWLAENSDIPYTTDELFAIREQCIKDLEHAS